MKKIKTNKILSELLKQSKSAHKNAYAPYSGFHVGSALLLSNGKIYSGCNIENASYGGTVCAERVAVWKAFSENKKNLKIEKVLVYTEMKSPWPPCGFCRQVLAEFSKSTTEVFLANKNGIQEHYLFSELLPHAFHL